LPIAAANSGLVGAVENAASFGWYLSCCNAMIKLTPSWYCDPPTTMSAFDAAILAAIVPNSVVFGGYTSLTTVRTPPASSFALSP
jgi:hypothetical protein